MSDTPPAKGRLIASVDLSDVGADAGPSKEQDADAAIQRRAERADGHIDSFVNGALTDREPGPRARKADATDEKPETATAAKRRLWEEQAVRVAKLEEDNPQFGEQARAHVWSIYVRNTKIETIADAIYGYILASRYYERVKNRMTADEFWPVFFEKIAYALTDVKDANFGTLADYIVIQDRETVGTLVFAVESLAAWAGAQNVSEDQRGDPEKDPRAFIRAFFTAPRPASDKSLLDMMRLALPAEAVERCLHALDVMDGKTEPKGRPAFNAEEMYGLFKAGRKAEAIEYLRKNAREVGPADMQAAFEEKGVDLFRLDILGAGKDESDQGRGALLQGALVNQYAKAGLLNLDYARHKLLREKGRTSQGRVDERGWNNYMQIAARPDFNPAFLENEHEFWDHMFRQMAQFRYRRPGNTKSMRELELEIARDLLDRPAKNGMSAFHIAARYGNAPVVKYLLSRLISFYYANGLRQAQQRNLDADKLAELKKRQVAEMRENLNYLTGADRNGLNVFMHAIVANKPDIIQMLVGHFQDHPEYLEILSQVQVPLDGKKVTLDDFASRDFGHGRNTEAARLLRRVLKDAGDRIRARQQGASRVA